MQEIIDYIILWLCYGNEKAAARVELSAPVDWTLRYPNMDQPLPRPTVVRKDIADEDFHIILSPDYIYNTFFFISRAEEILNSQRDRHDRFLAQYSILSHGNRLQIPMLDEYSRLICKTLEVTVPSGGFSKICLTHDIDTTDLYHHFRGVAGGLLRGQWREVWTSLCDITNDPVYTFPWIMEQDSKCKNAKCDTLFFVKQTKGRGFDYPQYSMRNIRSLSLRYPSAKWGWHSSYYGWLPGSSHSSLIDYRLHRSHFLRCSIDQMRRLADYGVTDDYTMGFPDMAGFRLQTCRPVRWIDPVKMCLTNLTLHPLTIMDCTLSNTDYMNLNEDEAYFYSVELIEKVRQHHGELVLLWHNSIFQNAYHTSLYPKLLATI